ncbi:hypothetical protein [Kitasatospora sp. NPDC001175]|uniref:hypothetical protein n=1 Tax=Kitasatospora sp. NPDC001175 TaxID=3157103 RepID=UPI003CFDAA19
MTDYTPSAQLTQAIADYDKAQQEADAARDALRLATATEMKTHDVTAKVLANHLPWSDETIRGIAREHDVPLKRAPTVRSIKPKKRTAGGKPSG